MTITEILEITDGTITNMNNLHINYVEIEGTPSDGYDGSYIDEAELCESGVWRDATDEELDVLNEDDTFVYVAALKQES